MTRLLLILGVALSFLLAALCIVVWRHGFPLALMDLNDSGMISPLEFLQSLDLGHRPASSGASTCIEIFQLKDGLPIKTVCHIR